MEDEGFRSFTISRRSGMGYQIENCTDAAKMVTLARKVSGADTGMVGQVNGQAVIKMIVDLQKKYDGSFNGFTKWAQELDEKLDEEARAHAARPDSTDRASASTAAPAVNRPSTNAGDGPPSNDAHGSSAEQLGQALMQDPALMKALIKLVLDNKDASTEFIKRIMEQAARGEGCSSDLQRAGLALHAFEKLSDAGEEDMLVKLLQVLAANGHKVEDWPVMVRPIKDFAKYLNADDLRIIRYDEDSVDFWASVKSMVAKGAFNFLQGYGQPRVNLDDDAGKSYRAMQRQGQRDSDDEEGADWGQQQSKNPAKVRMNFPIACLRTIQRKTARELSAMKRAGLHKANIKLHAKRMLQSKKKREGSQRFLHG